jgi:hypothetical protein
MQRKSTSTPLTSAIQTSGFWSTRLGVRETLAAWGMIAPDAPQSAVASELGLRAEHC